MKIRTSIAAGLVVLLLTIASIFIIPALKASSSQNLTQTEIPVVIKPLKIGNDIVPVDIQCEKVFTTKPNTLDRFTCILVNKTNKSISASSVRYSIIVDSNGKEEEDSRLDIAIPYIHPDLLEIKKPIQPEGKLFIAPPGPFVESDSVIKRLELEPVYIEFSDGTTAGVGGKSAEMIANVREGAAKYKNSLYQEYLKRGKSVKAILQLLEDDAPLDSETLNFLQQTGAKSYRNSLRKKYEKDGLASINKVLNQ
jgi:hypothetical protein